MQETHCGINAEQADYRYKAVIVGGSGGIGKALALELAERSIDLSIFGRSQDKLNKLADEIEAKHGAHVNNKRHEQGKERGQDRRDQYRNDQHERVKVCPASLDPDDTSLKRFLENQLKAELSSADIYIHALGPFLQKPLAQSTLEDWNSMLFYNLKLPALCASLAAEIMADRWSKSGHETNSAGGVIVLFGGTKTDTIRGFKTNAVYASAKTGLAVFAKSLAREYAGKGVSVIHVCPGFIETEYCTEKQKTAWEKLTASGKLTSTARFAQMVCDMALSPGVSLLSGSVITLDEGLIL